MNEAINAERVFTVCAKRRRDGGVRRRTLDTRSRKGDFRFGERDRRGADKRGSRSGEYVKRDRWFESISLQQRVQYEPEFRPASPIGGRVRPDQPGESVDPTNPRATRGSP